MVTDIERIQPGWNVITADHENVGEIEAIGTGELLVRKGWLFPSDHRLPFTAIQVVDPVDEMIHLGITKDQVEGLAAGSWRFEDQDAGAWGSGLVTDDVVANDLDAPAVAPQDRPAAAASSEDSVALRTHEEQLGAQTTARQVGEVDIRKEVVEEVQTIEVPVRREEVHIERRPATGATASGATATTDGAFQNASETIRVPIMEEQVEVTKTVRPVEEVEVSRQVVEGTETVSDTVRREELRVEGDTDLLDDDPARAR